MPLLITQGLGGGLLVTQGLGADSAPVVGGDFHMVSAVALDRVSLRVKFNIQPRRLDPTAVGDALRAANWQLVGPVANTINVVLPAGDDPLAVDLFVNRPLAAGAWTVTGGTSLLSAAADAIGGLRTLPFTVSAVLAQTPLDGGATTDQRVLRKHLNQALKGPGWNAFIEAVDEADRNAWADARAARDQLALSTAAGSFLEQRAGERGVTRPAGVGMSDAIFRRLALALSNRRLTDASIHDLLEAFYAADAVRASATATTEPYELRDGDELQLLFGEHRPVTVVFARNDATNIGRATADEVAAAINRGLRASRVAGFASRVTDGATGLPAVRVYADARGLASSLRVLGGRAQVALRFPHEVFPNAAAPFGTWDVTASPDFPGVIRWNLSGATTYDLLQVEAGDQVLVYGEEFVSELRATYTVTRVSVTYPGGVLTQWFETAGTALEAGAVQQAARSLTFLHPVLRTLYSQSRRAYASQSGDGVTVTMPVTSPAVVRGIGTASYLHGQAAVATSSVVRDQAGVVTVTTVTPHGLVAGGQALVDGLRFASTAPAIGAGTPSGTLGASFA